MQDFLSNLMSIATTAGSKILLAIVVLVVGIIFIKSVLKLLGKSRFFNKVDKAAKIFSLSFIKIVFYTLLIISVIGILGVPIASIVAVLASAGVAIGLALQGALSNLAGGIMLMIF